MLHKAIKGYEDYLISDTGQVYSLKSGRYLKGGIDRYGYKYVTLSNKGIKHNFKIHRLVAQAFIPNPENKPTVDHVNRIRSDNRVENLRWANYKEQVDNKDYKDLCRHLNNISKIGGEKGGKVRGEQLAIPIIEILDNELKEYKCLSDVPNMNKTTLSYHVNRGEKEFIAKGRHFKLKGGD